MTEGTLVEESTTELDYKTETTEDPTKYTDEETAYEMVKKEVKLLKQLIKQ